MALALICVPLAMAVLAFALPSNRWRPWLLPLTAAVHLAMTVMVLQSPRISAAGGWLVLDPLGEVFLGFISLFFFICMLYAPGYLALRRKRANRAICSCLMISLSMMTLVILSHHLGLMWVAMEATTLATAPSLYFNHNARSLEATWKYLLICSVGIALALLGSFFLAYASLHTDADSTLLFDDLVKGAPNLSLPWLHAAFVLLFVGYGTKMGLAPMHTWKPDAYGEAPGLVGALLAGGLTNCAFLAILRCYQIMNAAGEAPFAQRMMLTLGIFSMAVAAVFMIRQRDLKRLLAYSSVEHMGILVFGIGIGGPAVFGALLHVINNGLTKGVLFLSAGNIHRAFESKVTDHVSGAMRRLPLSGAMLLAGYLAGTGSPPFSPFVSEFTVLSGTLSTGHFVLAALFVVAILIAFLGMGVTILKIVLGEPPKKATHTAFRDGLHTGLPILICMGLVLMMGLYMPPTVTSMLDRAASLLAPRL